MLQAISFSALLLVLISSSCIVALPPDFLLDEEQLLAPAQSQLQYYPGFTLVADKSGDGVYFVSGSTAIQGFSVTVDPPVFICARSASGGWSVQRQLLPPSGFGNNSIFGISVSIYGDYVAVGSPESTSSSYPGVQGFIFIYKRQGNSWSLPPSLSVLANPTSGNALCRFGRAVSVYGTRLLAGCHPSSQNLAVTTGQGAVYLYDLATLTAIQEFVTRKPNPSQMVDLSVALCASVATFISVDPASLGRTIEIHNLDTGSAYLYSSPSRVLGTDLDCDGTSVLAGDRGNATLLVYSQSSDSYVVEHVFSTAPEFYEGSFGTSVNLLGSRALVGSPLGYGKSHSTGAAYVFYKENGAWDEGILVAATDGISSAQYGLATALTSTQILIGGFGSYCQICMINAPLLVYVYNQSNACGVPPVPNSPTVCSAQQHMYYFNPNLQISTPVTLLNPIVFTGNLSVISNVTARISGDAAPLTALGCIGVNSGSLNVELNGPSDDTVAIAKSHCITGQFTSVNLTRSPSDCRRYTVKGQENDIVTGSLNVVLDVDHSGCSTKNKIIIGSVVGGVAFLALVVTAVIYVAYIYRIGAFRRVWQTTDNLDDPLIAHV